VYRGDGAVLEIHVLTLAIDPGHPSHDGDTGSVSTCGRIVEPDYTIHIARLLHHAIAVRELPITQVLLRERNDEVVSVAERARRATDAGADLVLSIHVDAWHEPTYQGAHILYWPSNRDGKRIADQIAAAWPPILRRRHDGYAAHAHLWPRTYNVLEAYEQTSILCECGYASNPRDVDALVEDTVQDQIVGALLQGIRLFRQMREAHWLR